MRFWQGNGGEGFSALRTCVNKIYNPVRRHSEHHIFLLSWQQKKSHACRNARSNNTCGFGPLLWLSSWVSSDSGLTDSRLQGREKGQFQILDFGLDDPPETQIPFQWGQIFVLTPSRFSLQHSNYFIMPLSSILSCFVLYQICFSLQETASDSDLHSVQITNLMLLQDYAPLLSHYLLSLWHFCLSLAQMSYDTRATWKNLCFSEQDWQKQSETKTDSNKILMCHIWSDGCRLMWTEKQAVCSLCFFKWSDRICICFRWLNTITQPFKNEGS